MAYFCKDCSYRGKSSGPDGGCPACGSFNFGRGTKKETRAPSKWRLRLLIGLWTWLIVMIIWKVIN
jgi:hypothetical protein